MDSAGISATLCGHQLISHFVDSGIQNMTPERRRHHFMEMVINRVFVFGISLNNTLMTQIKIRAVRALGITVHMSP